MDYLLNLEKKNLFLGSDDKTVLNLIINGLPSKHMDKRPKIITLYGVLNLIINGLPSKLPQIDKILAPYYVLNLIINGLPSKPKSMGWRIWTYSI